MNQYSYILKSTVDSRKVLNPVEPAHSFHSAPGFFCIAHRGASYYAPENTLPAFQKAVELKADMIELDVTLSRDKIPVVFHDKFLHRTTNGKGDIQNFYERELKELDAGSWFGIEYAGTKIPKLEDVLGWAKGSIALNIEIKKESVKNGQKGGVEEIVFSLLDTYKMSDQVILSSFSTVALKSFQRLDSNLKTAALLNPYSVGSPRSIRFMKSVGARGVNMLLRQMRSRLMKAAKREHIPVWVYTIDDEIGMKRAIKKGATGIFTNRPDSLRKVVVEELQGRKVQR